jgi:peptidoglycan/LPS O-acetylase OafA/YrhL
MRFHALDGLRGFCALIVAIFHLYEYANAPTPTLLANSFVFVDFFFVLSGFVLAHAFMDDLAAHGEGGLFVLRRIGRLYPLHLFMLGLFLAVEIAKYVAWRHGAEMAAAPFTNSMRIDLLVSGLFLTQSLGLHDGLGWNFPSWSISVEFYVNLLFCMVMVLPARRGGDLARTLRGKIWLCAVLAIVAGIVTVWAASLGKVMTFDTGLPRCIYGFFLGVLAQRLRAGGVDPTRNFSRGAIAALEIACALATMALIQYGSYVALFALSPPLFAGASLVFAHERGLISALLLTRPMKAIGEWSYSIYLVHSFLVIHVMGRLASLAGKKGLFGLTPTPGVDGGFYVGAIYAQGPLQAAGIILVFVALTLGFSALTFRFIEKPGRSFFNAYAARKSRFRRTRPTGAQVPAQVPAPVAAPVAAPAE